MRFLHVSDFSETNVGISEALAEVGEVVTFDWPTRLKVSRQAGMNQELYSLALDYKPDLIFIEEAWTGDLWPETFAHIKHKLDTVAVSWNGDWRDYLQPTTLELGRVIDWTLLSNRKQVGEYCERGIRAAFLPAGCASGAYRPVAPDRERYPADIIFLGSPGVRGFPNDELRESMVREVYRVYGDRFRVYGRGWRRGMPFAYPYLEPQSREAGAYSSCKIALGINAVTSPGYTSARMWKAMGSGAFYLCSCLSGLEDWFKLGVHLDCWNTILDLLSKINYYLARPRKREQIASAGRAEVRKNHTWEARIRQLLEIVDENLRET
jgi:hypothetical protein